MSPDRVGRRVLAAQDAQQLDRIGTGELLAHDAGDETPAPDLAARLHPAQGPKQVAPRRDQGLAGREIARDTLSANGIEVDPLDDRPTLARDHREE